MVLLKNAIRHSVQKNITDSPLGPALLLLDSYDQLISQPIIKALCDQGAVSLTR